LRDALNYWCLYIGVIRENRLGETLLRLPLMLDSRLRVNLQRGSAVGVAHQFLNDLYVLTIANQKRGIGMPKSMPPITFRIPARIVALEIHRLQPLGSRTRFMVLFGMGDSRRLYNVVDPALASRTENARS
jgi:hypothetical protein